MAYAGGGEMTNIEYLLSITQEQMAELVDILVAACPPDTYGKECCCECEKCWERWLQEEREE